MNSLNLFIVAMNQNWFFEGSERVAEFDRLMNTHKYFSASFEIFPLNAKGEVVTDQSKNPPSLEELEAIANEGSGEVQGQSTIGVVVTPGIIDQAIPQEQLDRQEDVEDIVVSDEEEIDEKELYKETPQESPYEKE